MIKAGGISATCISRPIPWSPHFLSGIGTICLGSIWRGPDHTLFVHVVIHVARLLNWDEPIAAAYGGWNPDAVKWWRNHHGENPITKGLEYPALPVELTHGTRGDAAAGGFQVLTTCGRDANAGGIRINEIPGRTSSPRRTVQTL